MVCTMEFGESEDGIEIILLRGDGYLLSDFDEVIEIDYEDYVEAQWCEGLITDENIEELLGE